MSKKIIFFTKLFISFFYLNGQTVMNIHQNNGTIMQIPLSTIDSITYTISTVGLDIESNPGEGVTFDGYTYSSIVFGNGQEWMAENLRTSIYSNGDPIPNVPDEFEWTNLNTGAWVEYGVIYGKLYNWYAVSDSRNLCPVGWHVPSDNEWSSFINYLDPNADGGSNTSNTAGGKMKSVGTQLWIFPNEDATNESGFTALPAGIRYSGSFFGFGYATYWWSSTEYSSGSSMAYNRNLSHSSGNVGRAGGYREDGMSVRCLRD
jgi:uncharacterized protein (TIGR02145 family)